MLIHPFDHVDIVAGQGTVGLEILEQVPDVETIVVPCGGGGLLGGIAIAVKAQRPDVRVIGVQAEGAAAYPASLAAGQPGRARRRCRRWPTASRSACPGEVPFATVRDLVDEVVTVSEDVAVARAAGAARAGQDGRRAGRRGRRRRDAGRPGALRARRRSRCCPAATSTRCCWAR